MKDFAIRKVKVPDEPGFYYRTYQVHEVKFRLFGVPLIFGPVLFITGSIDQAAQFINEKLR